MLVKLVLPSEMEMSIMKVKVVYIEREKAKRINDILAAEKEFKGYGKKNVMTGAFDVRPE